MLNGVIKLLQTFDSASNWCQELRCRIIFITCYWL